jgi:hypothetical protein
MTKITVILFVLLAPAFSDAGIIWSADHEEGALSDWYYPSINATGDFGGGEYNSGIGDSTIVSGIAHSGNYAAKMTIEAPGVTSSGTRLFRWRESRQYSELYYSVWYYVPQRYTTGWANWFQWKSRTSTNNDPIFFLDVRNRATNGNMFFYLTWWNGLQIEGPAPGQSGYRTWTAPVDIPVGRWFNVEARYVCDGGFGGAVQVWQDGVEIFNLSGVRTRYVDGTCEWAVNNYGSEINPSPSTIYIDDAVISTTRIGSTVIVPQPTPLDTTSATVSITSPANGAVVARRSDVQINALASDNVSVARVEFYVNGSRICSDSTAPYSCQFRTGRRARTYSIEARAFDAAGNAPGIHRISIRSE